MLCAGVAINGAQSSMPALSARFYPTQCRATGVAWMSGIGRLVRYLVHGLVQFC
jgi:AAHS family 4-hydroxybenzoate transporter-like MFS transporter